jgi:hypothetical protein
MPFDEEESEKIIKTLLQNEKDTKRVSTPDEELNVGV